MLKQILAGYQKLFVSASKILALILFCLLIGAALVYPLWYLAVTYPQAYTLALLILCVVLAAGLAVRHLILIVRGGQTRPEKRRALFVFFAGLGKFLVVILGIAGVVYAGILDVKPAAFAAALLALFLYGMLAYGTKKNNPA
ncbi:MAG: hypothetical protein LBS97_04730 [Treponema sp.]|nr:hypothetical protein [Treponema sp.]